MFTRIEFGGYRSCEDVCLENLGPLTALIGRNASGKTSILRGIEQIAHRISGAERKLTIPPLKTALHATFAFQFGRSQLQYKLQADRALRPRAAKMGVELREEISRWQSRQWIRMASRVNEDLAIGRRKLQLPRTTPLLVGLESLLTEDDGALRQVRQILGQLRNVSYCALDETNQRGRGLDWEPFLRLEQFRRWKARDFDESVDSDSCCMRLLDLHTNDREQFNEIADALGPNGLGVIGTIQIRELVEQADDGAALAAATPGEPPNVSSVRFVPSEFPAAAHGGIGYSFGELSLGTRRIVRLITALVYDRSALVLVEHPEDGIHRGLLKKLIDRLRGMASPGQVLLTTHSPVVFNVLKPSEVRLVVFADGKSHVRALDEMEVIGARRFVEEEGALSDFIDSIEA